MADERERRAGSAGEAGRAPAPGGAQPDAPANPHAPRPGDGRMAPPDGGLDFSIEPIVPSDTLKEGFTGQER